MVVVYYLHGTQERVGNNPSIARSQGKKLLEEAALANKEQISRKEESRHKMADEEQVTPQTSAPCTLHPAPQTLLTPQTRNLKTETPTPEPYGLRLETP